MASDFGTFIIQVLWIFILVMFFIILFQIIIDLFSDHNESGWAKAIWIIFLILLPPITALIYLIARGKGMAERRQAQYKAAQQAQQAYIKEVAGNGGAADQIATAKSLLDAGTISQAEFDQIKAKALAS
ncbi:MAG: SHOCT domain-containing protein [Candidatus Nanopelagicales bacterium]|jgi:ABC-type multidrug transport system fused ATPase/permease subunit